MSTNTPPDVTVRITPTVAAEFASRDVFDGLHTPGTYTVPAAVAAELLSDADYYTDPDGPGAALTFGERSAYRRLRDALTAAGVTPPTVVRPASPPRPSSPAAVPFPIGDAVPGARVTVVATGRRVTVDRDQDDARPGFVWVTGAPGNALPADTEVTA